MFAFISSQYIVLLCTALIDFNWLFTLMYIEGLSLKLCFVLQSLTFHFLGIACISAVILKVSKWKLRVDCISSIVPMLLLEFNKLCIFILKFSSLQCLPKYSGWITLPPILMYLFRQMYSFRISIIECGGLAFIWNQQRKLNCD